MEMKLKHLVKLWPVIIFAVLKAQGAVIEQYDFNNVNQAIPDGNASGVSHTGTVPGSSGITEIGSVHVTLNISSDGNGSLYAYLEHDGRIAVLLNRIGRTATDLIGSDGQGLVITLNDSVAYADVHQAAGSPLTGTFQPDARLVDPSQVLDTSPRSAFLSAFQAQPATGDWTLFVANLESGSNSTLNSWSLQIVAVPESGVFSLCVALGLLGLAVVKRILHEHNA